MKWSRELKIAQRSMRTALRAVSASIPAPPLRLPKALDFPDLGAFARPHVAVRGAGRCEEVTTFGSNPGNLAMLVYTPAGGPKSGAPIIVLLHGCGQHASEFAHSTGWIALADELGFTLVMPEQSGHNNQGRCFRWFQAEHTKRGEGECLSIRQMVATAIKGCSADPKRVFVVGLSAGGAMAAALLAAYPDVFAGGAVVAGLPVGTASGMTQALMRMARPGPEHTASEWAEKVRGAGPPNYRRTWPRISIWHGAADTVVDPGNADLLATQFGAVLGLSVAPARDVIELQARHRTWSHDGDAVMEQWTVPGMAHGYPIDGKLGKAGPYIVDVGLAATRHIAGFWGLL